MNQPRKIDIVDYAILLVTEARNRGLVLRLVGSVAFMVHFRSRGANRPEGAKDIDLVTQKEWMKHVQRFMAESGWNLATELLMLSEFRETYSCMDMPFTIDIFYDEVDGNHPICVRERLALSFPTISEIDLLMTKLQRVEFRAIDIWDTCEFVSWKNCLLDLESFQHFLGKDWGLYTTVTDNLRNLVRTCDSGRGQIEMLLHAAATCRKSLAWRVRSIIGKRQKWWKDIYGASIVSG